MEEQIINRVAASPLVTFDLEEFYTPGDRILLDIKNILFQGMILREKDFRDYIRDHAWSTYQNKLVAITCSEDAVIPTWAYMLLSVALQPYAKKIIFGDLSMLESRLFEDTLAAVDWEKYKGAKVVVKGCSKVDVPVSAYVEATNKLRPFVSSIMYGEPCSTVPLYKKPK